VVVSQQHRPVVSSLAPAAPPAGATGLDVHVRARAPEGVGAGVDRVLQDAQDGGVDRQAPLDLGAPAAVGLDDRERQAFLSTPEQHLPRAAQRREALEDQGESLLHPLIRILLHAILGRAHVADRRPEHQFTPVGLGQQRGVGALAEPAQLGLADRALQPQQQPVVELARIVDPLGIDNQRVHQPAEIEQLVPVPIVAGQP